MKMKKYFSKNNIIINLAKYETYYQVALGLLISKTNTKNINSNIEINYALGSIYELLKDLEELSNIDDILEVELQKQSTMDALQNFVNQNLEAVKNGDLDIEDIVNSINDNQFFTTITLEICKKNINEQIKKYESIITNELSNDIMSSLLQMQDD